MDRAALPYLDLNDPGFSTRSAAVHAARDRAWCARTPFGLAVLRHREAGLILRDRRFRQGSHGWPDLKGLSGSFAAFWKRSIISQEGPRHKLLRQVVQTAMTEDYLQARAGEFRAIAQDLLEGVRPAGSIDFVHGFSEPFAGRVVACLLGLPVAQAMTLASDASALGLAMGADAPVHEKRFDPACDRLSALAAGMLDAPGDLGSDFVARLLGAAAELGVADRQTLVDLIVILIFGGVDTTRAQLAFAVALFIEHPAHWQHLRAHPEAIPQALEEVIRTRPTTTWSTREALEEVTLLGVTIRKGEVLHIFTHATGTDPAVCPAHRFDPTEVRTRHFGFGGGAHHCLGHFLARLDMTKALEVLAENWIRIDWGGTPEWLPDSGNTSPVRLPVRPDWVQERRQSNDGSD